MTLHRTWILLAPFLLACVPLGAPRTAPVPGAPMEGRAPPLPRITPVDGPLAPRVVYPPADAAIAARDSNFIFGSVGSGRASLTINGAPVRVEPNGAWLAFLPVPGGEQPAYELAAWIGADTTRLVHPIRVAVPAAPLPLTGPLVVDTASATPRGVIALRADERVRVSLRAPSNAAVWVEAGASVWPTVFSGGVWATDVPAGALRVPATIVAARGADTVRVPVAMVQATPPETGVRRLVALDTMLRGDTDRVAIARPIPDGTYKWMLVPGTVVEETGSIGSQVRVRLDSQLEAWVDAANAAALPVGSPLPRRVISSMTLTAAPEWVDLVMPVSSPVPYLIEQRPMGMDVILYGAQANPGLIRHLRNDTLVRVVSWIPEASDRVRLSLDLSSAPFGYLMLWDPPRGMVLRVRRPPVPDARRPLRGLTIVVDPGHPPGGAVGPTGLTEAEAVLPVSERLRAILEARGATVVMTRRDMQPVELLHRTVIARRADAHALISVHLNAFGDGVNPWVNNGTSTLFFHPQSEPLSRLVQAGMMRELGLRDLGIHYQNIAIGRATWMPSLITEGLFMMIPEQEHAMRTPEGQERYARGVADGIEAYFRSLRP